MATLLDDTDKWDRRDTFAANPEDILLDEIWANVGVDFGGAR